MNDEVEQRQTVRIDPVRAEAMAVSLGTPVPLVGEALPLFWHWSQFWVMEPVGNLGRDGHPKRGGIIPETGLPRRMWAGGQLEFHAPLIVGEDATRVSKVGKVTEKNGRSGPLAFVSVIHEIYVGDRLCVREAQDLVFREDAAPDASPPQTEAAPTDETVRTAHMVSTTDLFRYSALTFNGHRIHYDLEYAKNVEGYPGLITHGPLLGQRLIELAEQELGEVKRFTFRARSPVFHFEQFEACAKHVEDGLELWVRAEDGRLAMTAFAA